VGRGFAVAAALLMLFTVADSSIVRLAFAQSVVSLATDGSNNSTPPPPPPVPPLDQELRSVDPGTVTQGWSNNSLVNLVGDRSEPRLIEVDNSSQSVFETSYGNFFVSKDSPYFVGFGSRDDAAGDNRFGDSAFLVQYNGTILVPTDGVIDTKSSDTLAFHYDLLWENKSAGSIFVTYTFFVGRNKISASFKNAIGNPGDFQIVWLTYTTFDVVDTLYASGVEQRFEDLTKEDWGRWLGLYKIGWLDNTTLRPMKGASGVHLDMTDVPLDALGYTFAGQLSIGERSGNAVLVAFTAGNLTIDPQLMLNGVDQDATAWSGVQRKTFFDGDRYWIFYKYTGGGTSEIRYQSSTDGRSWTSISDAIQISGTLPDYFTIANYGKTVAVFWVNSASNTAIQIRTGLVTADRIQWDAAGHQLYSGSNAITEIGGATFTSQGLQFGITWRDTGGGIGFARYTCGGPGPSGFSVCATNVQNGPPDWGSISFGDAGYSALVAFLDGSGDIARFKVESSPAGGQSFVRVKVYHADGTACGDDADIAQTGAANGDAWFTDSLFTVAAQGGVATIFFLDTQTGWLRSYNVYSNCASQSDVILQGLATAKYLTAGTEQGGGALYLFYTVNGAAYYARIIPDGSNSVFFATAFPAYTNPYYLAAAPVSSHFVPLMFVRAYPPPPGISDGCTTSWSGWCLYYVNYPLPLDGEASVNNPWVLKLGAPLVTDAGGVTSPMTGLLAEGQVLVGGTPSINLIYREPGLLSRDTTNQFDVKYAVSDERYQVVPGIYYDVPWIGGAVGGMVHMQGGQRFPLILTGISGNLRWYNNTGGVRYTLMYDGGTTHWTLTLPSGAYLVFSSGGDLLWAYLDTTGQNYVQYNGQPGLTNAYIADASGRRITFTSTGLSYRNGQTITLTNLGIPVGCSGGTTGDSATLQVTDAIGRITIYSVCHWKLVKLESPNGGRVDYTYADYSQSQQVWQGTEAYSLPLLKMDVYNDSAAGVKARTLVFNWRFQNGEVVRALVNTTDKSAVVQGSKEYVFNSAMGTAVVRTYDSGGQVLYYDMDTLNGANMKDLSGNANDGTITGPLAVYGKYGRARDFSGASQWIETASSRSSLSMTDFATVSFWFQHDYISFPLNDVKGLVFKGANTGLSERNYEVYLKTDGQLAMDWCNASVCDAGVSSVSTYTDNSWHWVAAVFDWTGQTFQLYVDGVVRNSKTSSNSVVATNAKLVLGKVSETSMSTRFFDGRIDEVRLYHRVLSPEDVGILFSKNALKRAEQQNWYSINDQPHLSEGSVGDQTAPTVVTQDAVDDWGNQIYRRDPLGNETFASYANTNHQGQFYAPGRLTKNTATQFSTEFIDFSEDTFPPGGTWTIAGGSSALDYAQFDKVAPSLKLSSGSTITHTIAPAMLNPRFLEFRARLDDATKEFDVWFQTAGGSNLLGTQFVPGTPNSIKVWQVGSSAATCTYPGTGGSVGYSSNTWYRITFNIDWDSANHPWKVYLDGIDLTCYASPQLGSVSFGKVQFQQVTSGSWSAWVDDIKLYNNNCNLPSAPCTGYGALNIGFSGLGNREAIRLLSDDGTVIDHGQAGSSGLVFLSFNPTPNGCVPSACDPTVSYHVYAETGDNARSTVRIYAEDGTLEYQSPLTRFFVGEQYTYARPRTFADELVKTRSGALYWPSIGTADWGDEYGFCSQAGITCYVENSQAAWPTWREVDVQGTQSSQSARGVYVHVTPFDYGVRTHSFLLATAQTVPAYFVTYVKIPEGKSPDGIGLLVRDGYSTNWYQAYWGNKPSDPNYLIVLSQSMGPVPAARGGWIQLLVKGADFQLPAGDPWDSFGYQLAGGEAEWDLTTTVSDASLNKVTVSGLMGLSNAMVSLYDSANGVIIASGAANGGDSVGLSLYRISSTYNWDAFPVRASLKICSSTSSGGCDGTSYETDEYYFGSVRDLWPGDNYLFVGQSSFFDPKSSGVPRWPSASVHTSEVGSKALSGDCLASILCYDMETVTEGPPTVETGAGTVSRIMQDLSGHAGIGTFGGVPKTSGINQAAAGLGTAFSAGSDEVSVSMPAIDTVSGHWNTVSFWMYWTGTTNQMPFGFDQYALYFTSTYFGFNTNNGDLWGIDNTGLPNTLVYVTAEFYNGAGTSSKLYINGVPKTLAQKMGTTLSRTATASAKLSGWPTSASYKFGGTLDQVQVFNRALTDTEAFAMYQSRMPGGPQLYLQPLASGLIYRTRVPHEGAYLYAEATYDSKGNVLSVTDLGRGADGGSNVTRYTYSAMDGQDYVTTVTRPDYRLVYFSYDFHLGTKLGTLGVDCRRSRTQYDLIGRPIQTSIYDTDPNEVLHLDMETFEFGTANMKDVSCAGTSNSLNGNDAAISGTTEKDGVEGVSRDFNGGTDSLSVSDSSSLSITSSFTISAWVRWDTLSQTGGSATIVRKWDSSTSKGFLLDVVVGGANDKKLRACIGNGAMSCYYSTGTLVNSLSWYYVAAVFDDTANTVTFYINGVQSGPPTSVTVAPVDGTDALTVGKASSGTTLSWDGSIDDVRVFNAARAGPDIASLWKFTFKLLTQSSVAYDDAVPTSVTTYDGVSTPRAVFFDMETCLSMPCASGGSMDDRSGHGQDGVLTGTTSVLGKSGYARSFSVNTDKVRVAVPQGLPLASYPRTLTAWISPIAVSTEQIVAAYGPAATSGDSFSIGVDSAGRLFSDIYNGRATSTLAVSTGWHFVAAVYAGGSQTTLYLDGSSQTISFGGSATTPNTASGNFIVGQWASNANYETFNGAIDEVHLISRDLTPTEVSALYNGIETSHLSRTYEDGLGRTARTTVMDFFGPPLSSETLRPNGAGASTQWTKVGSCTANWDCVDESTPGSDGLTSYVKSTTNLNVDRYALTDLSATTGTIVSLEVHARADGTWIDPPPTFAKLYLMVNGYTGSLKSVGGDAFATDFYDTWTTNPATGNAWTISEVNNLEVGIKQIGSLESDVSQLYVVVTLMQGSWGQHRLSTVATLGWNDRPSVAYIPSGAYFQYSYDFLGRTLTTLTPGDPSISGLSRSIFSDKANMIESVDAVGRRAYEKADLLARAIETGVWNPSTGAYGNLTKVTYNALSEVVTSTDANGKTTTTYYNAFGKPKMTVFPDGSYSVVYYDDNMRAFESVDVMGRASVTAYDSLGRVTSTALKSSLSASSVKLIDQWLSPVAGTSTYYNTWSGQTGCTSSTHYDCVNDGASPDDATSYVNTATTSQKESHLMDHLTIPAGYTNIDVTWEGRCQRAASQAGGEISHVVRETDGTATESVGGDKEFVCPSGSWQTFTYFMDKAPDGAEWTPAEINALECGYASSTDVSPAPSVTNLRCHVEVYYAGYVTLYSYDPVQDDLLSIDNITSKVTRTYDSLHRLKTETFVMSPVLSAPEFTGTLTYQYDHAGKVTDVQYPAGLGSLHAVYVYDPLGRVQEVDYGGSKYAVLTYDSAGRLDNIHYWKGSTDTFLQEKYTYDIRDRITQIKVFNGGSTSYMQQDYTSYDRASEVIAVTDDMFTGTNGASNPKSVNYYYDGNGRLAKAVGPYGTSEATENDCYDYDAVGNLNHWKTGASTCSTVYTYSYGASPAWNRLDSFSFNSMTFTYNAAGSMLTKVEGGSTTYTHDFLQQLTKVASGSSTYTYGSDGLGRRVKAVDPTATSYFMYSGGAMVYSKVGATESAFVYVGDRLLLRKDSTTGDAKYYHFDLSNNVRLITYYTASIQVDAKFRYKPFGDIIVLTTPGTDPRFKFSATEFDSSVRLYHMGARYHDPVVGRFIERDPIGPGYSYAMNNPILFRDPSGMTSIFGELKDAWNRGSQTSGGKTAINIALLAVAIATSLPSGGTSLAIYAAVVAGGLIVGAIFVAYTYVASAGSASFDDYVSAFTLGFTIGAVVGGGAYALFGVEGKAALGVGRAIVEQSTREEAEGAAGAVQAGAKGERALEAETGDVVSKESLGAPTASSASTGGQTTQANRGFQSVLKGQEGERLAGISGPKSRIDSLTGTARYRIPDKLDLERGFLREVKNVKELSMTSQLLDDVLYAREVGLEFQLQVAADTEISHGLLYDFIMSGEIKLMVLP